MDCGDSQALALDRLLGAAITLSVLAIVMGIGALISQSERKTWAALGIVLALVVTALVVVPGPLGGYECGEGTP